MNNPSSLAAALDNINEAIFYGRPVSDAERVEAAQWLVRRQVKSGRGIGMFAATDDVGGEKVRLFTGEKLQTKLATRNILGQEAARAILLWNGSSVQAQETLERANRWMRHSCYASQFCVIGECAYSAIGFMRYLAAGGFQDAEGRLAAHLEVLSQHRDGKGRWERFPFYYTLLALSEMELLAAMDERRYAAPACERYLERSPNGDSYSQRRRAVVERILAKC